MGVTLHNQIVYDFYKFLNMKISTIFLILFALFISNFISILWIGKKYHYSNADSSFEYSIMPSKGLNLSDMEYNFKIFLEKNPKKKDTILYRTFPKNYLKFWNYREYFFDSKWKYPHLDKE